MKKFLLGLACGVVLTTSTAVYASDSIRALLFPAKVTFHMNDEVKELNGDQTSVLNYNNRTYIPLRLFSESMGSMVNYSDSSGPRIDVYVNSSGPVQAPDPQSYQSPTTVKSTDVLCSWTFHQYDTVGTRIYGDPLNPALGINKDELNLGESLGVSFSVTNIAGHAISLNTPVSFEVDIKRRIPSDQSLQVVWSGKLSSLTSDPLVNAGSMKTTFQWDQKDSDGKQVPPGEYFVNLKVPTSIKYTKEGKEITQMIEAVSMGTSHIFNINQ